MAKNQTRVEEDSLGEVHVPINKLWGAQTQRALGNFFQNSNKHPEIFVKSYIQLKRACAAANAECDGINKKISGMIVKTCDQLVNNFSSEQYPLSIWQSGSGTQTNMNINEVIANSCNQTYKLKPDSSDYVHPNDHVNASQSTNDTYPTAIQVAVTSRLVHALMPTLITCREKMRALEEKYSHVIKMGRTHLQDAVPMSTGQMFSCYQDLLNDGISAAHQSLDHLFELPIGGTAIGTGLSAPHNFDQTVCDELSTQLKLPFNPAKNKFSGISAHLPMLHASHALSSVATTLQKIANDIRLLASGPRSGLMELKLPSNEPGSSIMPGKVNPTQCEALIMACLKVCSNHNLIQNCCAAGTLELNVTKPLIGFTLLESIEILNGVVTHFNENCLTGIELNQDVVKKNIDNSLMLVTGLRHVIGYDKAAKIAQRAYEHNITLKQANHDLSYCDDETFDKYTNPATMLGHTDDDF